jgi:TPR repeat protein
MAMYNYANCLRSGEGVEQSLEHAFKLYQKLSSKGNAGGMYAYANMLRLGIGCEQDAVTALRIYKQLADNNIAPAIHQLAAMLAQGQGTRDSAVDEPAAARWFKKGAALGDPLCIAAVASWTCSGKGGIQQDWTEGFKLNTVAAQARIPHAHYNLGCHYFSGKGVAQDLELAVYYWEQAAEMRMDIAMLNLAKMYAQGLGVECDRAKALELYTAAVGTGVAEHEAFEKLMQKIDTEQQPSTTSASGTTSSDSSDSGASGSAAKSREQQPMQ